MYANLVSVPLLTKAVLVTLTIVDVLNFVTGTVAAH